MIFPNHSAICLLVLLELFIELTAKYLHSLPYWLNLILWQLYPIGVHFSEFIFCMLMMTFIMLGIALLDPAKVENIFVAGICKLKSFLLNKRKGKSKQ